MASGVAQKEITDWEAYEGELMARLGQMNHLMRRLHDSARQAPRTMVYAAGESDTVLKAAVEVLHQGLAKPIILGDESHIQDMAKHDDLDLAGIQIINHRSDAFKETRHHYAQLYAEQNWRKGAPSERLSTKCMTPITLA